TAERVRQQLCVAGRNSLVSLMADRVREATGRVGFGCRSGSGAWEPAVDESIGLLLQDVGDDFDAVVKSPVPYEIPLGADGSVDRIPGALDQPRNARLHQRAGDHHTWLQGGDEGASKQTPALDCSGCLPDREKLRLRCG